MRVRGNAKHTMTAAFCLCRATRPRRWLPSWHRCNPCSRLEIIIRLENRCESRLQLFKSLHDDRAFSLWRLELARQPRSVRWLKSSSASQASTPLAKRQLTCREHGAGEAVTGSDFDDRKPEEPEEEDVPFTRRTRQQGRPISDVANDVELSISTKPMLRCFPCDPAARKRSPRFA